MREVPRGRLQVTFRVLEAPGQWRVWRDQTLYGDFLTRSDALRAACFGARAEAKRGSAARVFAPDDQPVDPYKPNFGE